jgi:hypothetical protein
MTARRLVFPWRRQFLSTLNGAFCFKRLLDLNQAWLEKLLI